MPTHAANQPSVLIVGAGPTGLTLAASLARRGVPFRIVDRKPGLSRYTKASNLMQRSQEVLGALGIAMPVDEIGGPMRSIAYEVHGRSLGRRTMMQHNTPYQGVLLCGQNRFEERVAANLAAAGVKIDFDTELVASEQDGEGVTATLRSAHGDEIVRCRYLIGCDGANGPTRRFTRWDFQPHRTGVAVRQVDCRLAWSRSTTQDQMWLFYFTNGFLAVVPLPGGLFRIATHEPVGALPEGEPDLAEMEDKLRRVTGDPSCRLSDLDWSTRTDLSMGIADGLRDGRIILAGDAGNPILPNGGQGMNVGISDAFNLGWKLAAVLDGGPDALLDTYATERLKLRVALEKFQWTSLKYTTLSTPAWLRWLMPRVLELALDRGGEAALARVFSQLGEGTRGSTLTLELAGRSGLRAGDRVPDAAVVAGGRPVRLFDTIYAGGWSVLAFVGTGRAADPVGAADALKAFALPDVACRVVSTTAWFGADVPILHDLDGNAHRTTRLTRPTILLVRPDGYVAARARPGDVRRLVAHARRWIAPAGGAPGGGDHGPLEAVTAASTM